MKHRQQKPLTPATWPTLADSLDEAAESLGATINHIDDATKLAAQARDRHRCLELQKMLVKLKGFARDLVNLHVPEKTA